MNTQELIKLLRNMQGEMVSEAELYCAEPWYGSGNMVFTEPEDYAIEEAIKALEKQDKHRWIPVSERLPKCEKEVLLSVIRTYEGKTYKIVVKGMCEDGTMHTDNSRFVWDCCWERDDFIYIDETDDYLIPMGWYEQNQYCDEFGMIDDEVIAWMPLPEPYKGEEE